MREASERLALRADGIREHFGYVDPEARAGGHGERRYEPEDAEHRYCGRRIRQRQLPGDEGVHGDHRRSADHYEDAPPHLVDYGERDRGEDEVHEPHAHRAGEGRERRPLAEYHLENPRRIVVDRVDSAYLVEERDEERKKDWLQEPALEKRHVDAVRRGEKRSLDLFHGFGDPLAPYARENLCRVRNAPHAHKPARGLGNRRKHNHERDDRDALDAEHHAPHDARVEAGHVARDEVVGDVAREDAEDDVELVQAHEKPAPPARRDFDDVQGNDDGNAADGKPADEAEPSERMRARGASRSERAAESRNEEENRHRPESRTASEPVAWLPGQKHAEERADKRHGHDEPVPERAKPELGLDRLLCT